MNKFKESSESVSEIKRQRSLNKNIGIAMGLLLIALLMGSGVVSPAGENPSTYNLIWGCVSIVAFASLLLALYISYRASDERQRLVQLKATSVSFIVVILGLVTALLFDAIGIADSQVSIQVVLIGGLGLWIYLTKMIERRSN